MKKIFLVFLLCLLAPNVFADRTGTILGAGATVGDSDNTFASAYCDEINGCNHAVADITARNAIPDERRAIGMEIKTLDDGRKYFLSGGITNSDWEEVSASGGWTDGGTNVYSTTSTDNVGVGTALPVTKFQVKGGDTTVDALNILGGGTVGTFASTGGFGFDSANNPYVSPKVYIDTSGNVGVGTTLPNYKFDVNGNMQAASLNASGEGSFIQGAAFTLDFDDGGPGVLRMSSTNIEGGNNQSVDFDLATTTGTLNILSPSGATHIKTFGDLTVADKVKAPILQAGSAGDGSWDVSSTVVAQYLMEENAGTATMDNFEGTAAYDGTCSFNTSTLSATGKIDLGFDFDGGTSCNFGSDSGLKFVHSFSTCVWINTTSTDTNIGGNRANATPYNGWRLFVSPSGTATFLVDGGATNVNTVSSGFAVNDNAWHFVCGVREEGVGIKIYVDGVLAGNTVDLLTYDTGTNAANTKIGDIPLVSVTNGDPYIGLMDNFSLYDSALTSEEIIGLYANGLGTNSFTSGGASIVGGLCVRDEDGLGFTILKTQDGIGNFDIDTTGYCDD